LVEIFTKCSRDFFQIDEGCVSPIFLLLAEVRIIQFAKLLIL
jgi:hypothetical protein